MLASATSPNRPLDPVDDTGRERLHLALMLGLTFSTGIVDATGYLGLDRVFTGNMTGNVVILGMALLGGDGLPVIGPVIALCAFVLGAMIAGRVLKPIPSGWSVRTSALFGGVAVLLAAAAVVASTLGPHMESSWQYTVTAMLAVAMGMQAGTARHVAVKDVTTVVVTSTLAGLAADSFFGGRKKQPWVRRAAAVALIGLGALLGTLTLHASIAIGLVISAAISAVAAIAGTVRGRGEPARPAPARAAA